jgi:hypothetical protein
MWTVYVPSSSSVMRLWMNCGFAYAMLAQTAQRNRAQVIQKDPRSPAAPAPIHGDTRRRAAGAGSLCSSWPRTRETTATPAPTPAATNDTVEIVASVLAESYDE